MACLTLGLTQFLIGVLKLHNDVFQDKKKTKMGLSEETIAILKATAPAVRANGPAITSTMYRIMTTNHPEVKNLFNNSHLRPDKDGLSPQVREEQEYVLYCILFRPLDTLGYLQRQGRS